MRRLQFDSVLLFALVVPFIMNYRLGSGETPFWLFGIIFSGLLSYICIDLFSLSRDAFNRTKDIALWFVTVVVIGSAFWAAMIVRHQTSPVYDVHDIIIQQEAAIRYFLDGKNPYAETYFGTPLEQWNYSETETNPALYHFVMQPFYLLFSLPFYYVSFRTVGFFDGRMPLLFLFFAMLVSAWALVKDRVDRRVFLILLAFNPAMIGYTLEGRSDIFMYAFLFAGWFLLYKHHTMLAGIPLAMAFAVKQSVWPMFPLYALYLFFVKHAEKDGHETIIHSLAFTVKNLIVFTIVYGAIVAPFMYRDSKAFIDSTVLYLIGSVPTSYPVSGYGAGMVLYKLGLITDLSVYYPFGIWQVLVGTPLIIMLSMYLKRHPSVKRLVISYGIFLMVYWYFSRYFNNSHVGYLSMVFLTAHFWPDDRETIEKADAV